MDQTDKPRAIKAKWPTATIGGWTYEARKEDGAFGMRKWPSEGGPSDAVELRSTSEAPAQALELFRGLA